MAVPLVFRRRVHVRALNGGLGWALVIGLCLCALFVALSPLSPDLSAQLARAAAASRGARLWWAGWYGGLNTATYSLTSGYVMGLVGVGTVGVVSTLVVCVAGADLIRGAHCPRAGAVAISLAACSNLYSGRVTYAAGMAIALLSFCLLRRDRIAWAVLLSGLSGLVSPLAAMCVVMGLVPLLARGPRRPLLMMAGAAGLPVALLDVLFGQPSYMPFSADILAYCLLLSAGVLVSSVPRDLRILAMVWAVAALGCWLIRSPIGSNIVRAPILAAAPLVIAYGRPRDRLHRIVLLALLFWPVFNVASDMAIAAQPSSAAAYYQPLLQRLPAVGTSTQRVEVLDPASHAGSYFLAAQVPLARGWERQIDAAANPLFYDGTLNDTSYLRWLVQHAVGWVAVPSSAELDYGSEAERALINTRLPYLQQTWHSRSWRLYRVTAHAPAGLGPLVVTALQDHAIAFTSRAAGRGLIRTPFSTLLVAHKDGDPTVQGCVAPSGSADLSVTVPQPGSYHLVAELGDHTCPRDKS